MVSSHQLTVKFKCPGCGAQYEVPASMAGKRGPCAKCGAEVQVPAAATTGKKKTSTPEYVPVECVVCQTLYYGRPDQIGEKLKCPDCGHGNELRPRPQVRAKQQPAALEGEQYEVWDVDSQPLPGEIAAAQPTYIAVLCTFCSTLMHATLDQVGQEIGCPDCGRKQVVPPPPEAPRSVLESVTPDLEIDPLADPGERPAAILPPVRRMLYEEEEEAERKRVAAIQSGRKKGKPPRVDARGRPVMPDWPLVSGILPFLFKPGTPGRWLVLSMGLAPLIALGLDGLSGWLGFAPAIGQGGQAAYAGTIEIYLTVGLGLIWSAYAASTFLTVAAESSEGNERIYDWPSANFIESMPDLGRLAVTLIASPAPGWAIGFAVFDELPPVLVSAAISVWVCFPIVLLSQMAGTSPFSLLNGQVLASFARCPFSWLLFYAETAALAALCIATVVASLLAHYFVIAAFAPLYVAAILLYARLVGRLGWRVAEVMSASDEQVAHEK